MHNEAAGSRAIALGWARIASHLRTRLAGVEEQIHQYPAPIPGCDAQFNHLLELRSDIPREMARARDLAQAPTAPPAARRALAEFLQTCPYLVDFDSSGIGDNADAAS